MNDLRAQIRAADVGVAHPSPDDTVVCPYVPPTPRQVQEIREVTRLMVQAPGADEPGEKVEEARKRAHALGLQVTLLESRRGSFLILHERREPFRGWGLVVLRADRPPPDRRLVIEAPHPSSDRRTEDWGMRIFLELRADAFVVAGALRDSLDQPSPDQPHYRISDMAHVRGTFFEAAHEGLTDCGEPVVIQVHGFSAPRHHRRNPDFPADQQIVLSDSAAAGSLPPHLARLQAALVARGLKSRVVTSRKDPLSGTLNIQRRDLAARGKVGPGRKGEFIHMEVDAALRLSNGFVAIIDALKEVFPPSSDGP